MRNIRVLFRLFPQPVWRARPKQAERCILSACSQAAWQCCFLLAFFLVHCLVGFGQQFIQGFALAIFRGDMAKAEAEWKLPVASGISLNRGFPQPLGSERDRHLAELACHCEFVSADSSQDIGFAEGAPENNSGLSQECRAGAVAERVVDLLQIVQIDEQDRERKLIAIRQSQRLLGKQVEPPEVLKAGQFVAQ
jgi:hypothetical protein